VLEVVELAVENVNSRTYGIALIDYTLNNLSKVERMECMKNAASYIRTSEYLFFFLMLTAIKRTSLLSGISG